MENLAVEVLLATVSIDQFIRGMLPGERTMVPWHSGPVPILTRQFAKSERTLSHKEPLKIDSYPYMAIVRIEKQAIFQSFIKTRVNTTTPVSDLSILEPEELTQ